MTKAMGASFLVAGTCIGSGMIALPMVLSSFGLLFSCLLMFFIWLLMYFTSLMSLELNLKAKMGLALGPLAKHYSGDKAKFIGNVCLKLLSAALMTVYIYGGASITNRLIESMGLVTIPSLSVTIILISLVLFFILLLPLQFIERINRYLFLALLILIVLLTIILMKSVNISNLPLLFTQEFSFTKLSFALPVVFTAFGFQVIFHTLTDYCSQDAVVLKKSFFWGSLIANLTYLIWTFVILSSIFANDPAFYEQMANDKAQVGDLIYVLSSITKWDNLQALSWVVTLLAIVTSALGVGIGLIGSFEQLIGKKIHSKSMRQFSAVFFAILPPFISAILIPNAFITMLGFAGLILAIIAIILPTYLFFKAKFPNLIYKNLRHTWLIVISLIVAFMVIFCEVFNFFLLKTM